MTTLAEAFEAAARVRAVKEWADTADKAVRAFIAGEIESERERTGVTPKYDVKGVITAGWTQPNRSVHIEDREALGKWGLRPGLSHQRLEVEASALQHDLDAGQLPVGLLDALTDAGYIRKGWVFGGALEAAADDWVEDRGRLITSDGEIVPGVTMIEKSSPALRVVPAPQAVKKARMQLEGRLSALALPMPIDLEVVEVEPGEGEVA